METNVFSYSFFVRRHAGRCSSSGLVMSGPSMNYVELRQFVNWNKQRSKVFEKVRNSYYWIYYTFLLCKNILFYLSVLQKIVHVLNVFDLGFLVYLLKRVIFLHYWLRKRKRWHFSNIPGEVCLSEIWMQENTRVSIVQQLDLTFTLSLQEVVIPAAFTEGKFQNDYRNNNSFHNLLQRGLY